MALTPLGPPVRLCQLSEDEANDLAERQRDDGEIVAAQPQHRKSEQHAPACRENAGKRQTDPE